MSTELWLDSKADTQRNHLPVTSEPGNSAREMSFPLQDAHTVHLTLNSLHPRGRADIPEGSVVWEQGCPEAVGGEMSLGGCLGTAARLLWGFAVLEGVFVASVNIPLLLLLCWARWYHGAGCKEKSPS